MRAHFEKVSSGRASLLAFERHDCSFPFYWHYHPEFELTLILDSRGQRLVGNGIDDYAPGDVVLLGPNLPHSWRSAPSATSMRHMHRAIVVQFRRMFLGEQFFNLEEMEPVRRVMAQSLSGLAFGQTPSGRSVGLKLAKFPLLNPGQRLVSLIDILLELGAEPAAQTLSTNMVKPICRVEDQRRIETLCTYFSKHYDQKIDFNYLANSVHMDQASLCRFFKRATGRTMTAYVNELRIGVAAQLLAETDESIIDIGFRVGFGNYSNFNRQFKKIKSIGPRDLRRQFVPHTMT
jgi:AraC-like DNA-binding protein